MGSGNIGATNVHRTAGSKAGMVVLLLDVLKGFVAVWLAARLNGGDLSAVALAAVAVMIGHCYPVFLNFKGGKAVACFLGAFIYFAPSAVAVTVVAFVIVVAISKYVSLGSLAGTVVFPLAVWILGPHLRSALWASIAASLLVIFRHKGNIARLRSGTEAPFSLKGGSDTKGGKD